MDLDLVLSTLRLVSLRSVTEGGVKTASSKSLTSAVNGDAQLLREVRSELQQAGSAAGSPLDKFYKILLEISQPFAWDNVADYGVANPRRRHEHQGEEFDLISFQVLCRGYLLVVEVSANCASGNQSPIVSVTCEPALPELLPFWPRLAKLAADDDGRSVDSVRCLMSELASVLDSAA